MRSTLATQYYLEGETGFELTIVAPPQPRDQEGAVKSDAPLETVEAEPIEVEVEAE